MPQRARIHSRSISASSTDSYSSSKFDSYYSMFKTYFDLKQCPSEISDYHIWLELKNTRHRIYRKKLPPNDMTYEESPKVCNNEIINYWQI